MGTETNEVQYLGVGLPIDQNEVGTYVAVTVARPITGERVIVEPTRERSVLCQLLNDCSKGFEEGVAVSGSHLSLEVLLEAGASPNRPHSDRPSGQQRC